jgi:hypothetical protein
MRFQFRSLVQVTAGPTQQHAVGWRELCLHASNVHEAAERFLSAQLERKRERTLAGQHREESSGRTSPEAGVLARLSLPAA